MMPNSCKSCIHELVCGKRIMRKMLEPDGYELACKFHVNRNDVAKVVRCKDCRHKETDAFNRTVCKRDFTIIEIKNNDFCSYGERSVQ